VSVVLVTWHDAHSGAESWIAIKELDLEPAEVESVGYLLTEAEGGKPNHITLFQSRIGDSIDHVLHIPVGMVQKMKVLMELEIIS
jgi:hypothetical protein